MSCSSQKSKKAASRAVSATKGLYSNPYNAYKPLLNEEAESFVTFTVPTLKISFLHLENAF